MSGRGRVAGTGANWEKKEGKEEKEEADQKKEFSLNLLNLDANLERARKHVVLRRGVTP